MNPIKEIMSNFRNAMSSPTIWAMIIGSLLLGYDLPQVFNGTFCSKLPDIMVEVHGLLLDILIVILILEGFEKRAKLKDDWDRALLIIKNAKNLHASAEHIDIQWALKVIYKEKNPVFVLNLNSIQLSNINLRNLDLTGAVLIKANLSGADLRGVKFEKANLTGANLVGAKVEKNWLKVKLEEWDVIGKDDISSRYEIEPFSKGVYSLKESQNFQK
jgi:Pentapeptide repeats (8 copies)